MTLKQWADNRWLKEEKTSREEIFNLLAIVERDMEDAKGSISPDWRFGIAYNAALKLCTVLMRAEGYRAAHGLQHYRTIMALPVILCAHHVSNGCAQYYRIFTRDQLANLAG